MPHTRRTVVGAGAAGLAAALLSGTARGKAADRPNILWLVSEDNNPFLGAYGDTLAHTPNIDRLAQSGILYRHAYCNAPVCAPSRFTILTGIHPESCAPANHMRAKAELPEGFRTYPELMRAAGYFCTNNAKTDYNCSVDPERIWDRQGKDAHWRQRTPGQPFLAVFNHERTHESRLFDRTPGRVKGSDVQVPRYLPDTPGIRDDYASYYNLIERMDAEIGERIAELEADGLADDTIVFYYSDNGGTLPRSKRYCYEEGLRCALIVHVPAKYRHLAPAAPGAAVETPVSFIDLAPTLLSLAGATIPPQMAGRPLLGKRRAAGTGLAFGMRNRMDERIDFTRTVTDGRWRYIRNYMPHRPWGVHGAYQWQAKGYQDWEGERLAGRLDPVQARFFGPKPFEELYDLTADPDQIDNLAAKHAAVRRRLSDALDAHMLRINDNGFIPEGDPTEGWLPSRDRQRYPLRRLMKVAAWAASGDPLRTPQLIEALDDANPVVRYWAATGLLIRKVREDRLKVVAEHDPSAHVRIVAAETLASSGDAGAITTLAALAAEPQPWPVRLAALGALTALGEAARPALPVIETAASSEQEYLRNAGRYLAAVLRGTYRPDYPVFVMPT